MTQKNIITLNDTEIKLVDRKGQKWMRAEDIAKALGYQDARSITRLFNRNKDEFTNQMTTVVKLTHEGKERKTRIYSLRGSHLIAMLAKTQTAKKFRTAVLDMIEKEQLKISDKRNAELKKITTDYKEEKAARLALEDKTKQAKPVPFARLSLPEAIKPGAEIATNFACMREVNSADIGVQTETAFHQSMVFVSRLIRDNRTLEAENKTLKEAFAGLEAAFALLKR